MTKGVRGEASAVKGVRGEASAVNGVASALKEVRGSASAVFFSDKSITNWSISQLRLTVVVFFFFY